MTEVEFQALASQGYNRIPLVSETYADLDTPLGLYLKLAQSGPRRGAMSCLLESVVGGERFGRYSFIGLPARTFIRARGRNVEVVTDDQVVERHEGDPLAFIAEYQKRFKVALRPGCPVSWVAWPATSAMTWSATSSRGWDLAPSPIPPAWAIRCPTCCCC